MMISIIRKGPRFIMMEVNDIDDMKAYFLNNFKALHMENLAQAFDMTGEGYSVVFLTKDMKSAKKLNDLEEIIIFEDDIDYVLTTIIDNKKALNINRVRVAPRIILMRLLGNKDKIIDQIKMEYKSTQGSFLELINEFDHKGTILGFTKKSLNKNMCVNDLEDRALFIKNRSGYLIKRFRLDALRYINEGLDKKDWYEMEIRIYDMYEAYDLHYERVIKIIEILELGLILGEAWTKDYPRLFMAVGVYRLRFFSFLDPKEIKKILIGLEYLDDGTRICDYDLYYKRKKINWTDIKEENLKFRKEIGLENRRRIISRITKEIEEELLENDEKVRKTRIY
ncbi:hypothetical protein WG909_13500 [Peptostreptococcaceae bacterium AGR-M142]